MCGNGIPPRGHHRFARGYGGSLVRGVLSGGSRPAGRLPPCRAGVASGGRKQVSMGTCTDQLGHLLYGREEPSERRGVQFPVREVAYCVLAHLYERYHVLDGLEVLERNLQLGLFGCCHCRITPSVARLTSSPQSARDGRRRGEREGASSPGVVAMWRVSLARGRAAMGFPIRCRCPWRGAFRLARLS